MHVGGSYLYPAVCARTISAFSERCVFVGGAPPCLASSTLRKAYLSNLGSSSCSFSQLLSIFLYSDFSEGFVPGIAHACARRSFLLCSFISPDECISESHDATLSDRQDCVDHSIIPSLFDVRYPYEPIAAGETGRNMLKRSGTMAKAVHHGRNTRIRDSISHHIQVFPCPFHKLQLQCSDPSKLPFSHQFDVCCRCHMRM